MSLESNTQYIYVELNNMNVISKSDNNFSEKSGSIQVTSTKQISHFLHNKFSSNLECHSLRYQISSETNINKMYLNLITILILMENSIASLHKNVNMED
jgi:hypothetical protein